MPRKPRQGVAPIKLCPQCQYLVNQTVRVCPNCSFEYPVIVTQTIKNSILVEVTEQYQKIRGKKLSELNAEELAVYAKVKNKKGHAVRVAKSKALKDETYLDAFAKAMGYKPGWVDRQKKLMENLSTIEFYDIKLF